MSRCPSIHTLMKALTIASVLIAAACVRDDTDAEDAAPGVATDTGMASMDHSAMAMNRGPVRDADHEFLRMMSDHHQGLIEMASAAMSKGTTPQVQGDAHKLHTAQEAEMKQMVDMLRTAYDEELHPMIMASNKAMNDTLQQKSGAEYDRTFYRMVVDHHREGMRMMDNFKARVQRAEVRQMIDKMRADQQREIKEFEAKATRQG